MSSHQGPCPPNNPEDDTKDNNQENNSDNHNNNQTNPQPQSSIEEDTTAKSGEASQDEDNEDAG